MIGRRAFLRMAFVATASAALAPEIAWRRLGADPEYVATAEGLVGLLQRVYLPGIMESLAATYPTTHGLWQTDPLLPEGRGLVIELPPRDEG